MKLSLHQKLEAQVLYFKPCIWLELVALSSAYNQSVERTIEALLHLNDLFLEHETVLRKAIAAKRKKRPKKSIEEADDITDLMD